MMAAAAEEVDHYAVLGLPSGEAGALLTLNQIEKAYRNESRKRHPDKRPHDPNATADFQLLTSSFHALRDPASRSALDSRLRSRRDRALRDSLHSAKRRRFTDDLNHRERAAAAAADQAQRHEKENMVASDIQKELAAFQARNLNKPEPASRVDADAVPGLDRDKLLKVSWERDGGDGDYTAARLRELFGRFGAVEDIVMQSSSKKKKKGSAVVAMCSKESASAAVRSMNGGSLLVLPLHVAASTSADCPSVPSQPNIRNIFGVGLEEYEDSILKKLERAQQKQQGA